MMRAPIQARPALKEQQKKYAELRIIRHSINSGESAAGATGFAMREAE